MRVLLTGGTGFLGGKIAEQLAAAGHELTLLARRPADCAHAPDGARIVQGDLLDRASLERALEGADALIHAAALVKRWVPRRTLFDEVNVTSLDVLLDLAFEKGVSKVLYCSSFMALGPTDGAIGDEDTVHDGHPRNDYERTKHAADMRARARQAAGEALVVLYPGVVYGPGRLTDGNILGGAARDLLRGRMPASIGPGDRKQCLAHVDDVARGFLLALESAAPGSRYVLGGENLTVAEALHILADEGGVRPPRIALPYGVAGLVGKLLRWQAALTRIAPMLTDEEVEVYRHEWAYSSARAERELGYTVTPAEEGLRAMVRWLFEAGHARRKA